MPDSEAFTDSYARGTNNKEINLLQTQDESTSIIIGYAEGYATLTKMTHSNMVY